MILRSVSSYAVAIGQIKIMTVDINGFPQMEHQQWLLLLLIEYMLWLIVECFVVNVSVSRLSL